MHFWSNIFLLLTAIASIYNFFSKENKILWLFLPFTVLNILSELYNEKLANEGINNIWVGNIISIISIFFYLTLVSTFIKNKTAKKISFSIGLLFLLGFIVNCLFFHPVTEFHLPELSIGCFSLLCVCIYFFYELLNFPNETHLLTYPPFWITAGLLFNNACSLPVYLYFNYIMQQDYQVVASIFLVVDFLNILLYTLLIISFLCKIKLPKRYLSS